ncbi:DUF58 domain-containing protein [Chitinimonas sp.]|uniref:DUF58 domain-containing protein n=1 Tax=Chitinimonas sp. TaxID=1934313 RepID=UPI002F949231
MWLFPEALQRPLQARWQAWLQRRHPVGTRSQRLNQQRVYIFLSRSGAGFCLVLLAMLACAVNYDLALVYLLVFLLGAMALVSIFHTFRNLLGLDLLAGRSEPCFAGESARFEIVLENLSRLPRHNLLLRYGEQSSGADVAAGDSQRVWLSLPASRRGWLHAPRLRIETHWPLGVFRAWSYAYFEQRVLVYPQAELTPPALPSAADGEGEGRATPRGQDDFAGLRPFQRGDSPRHVAWKVAARESVLMIKEFQGQAAEALCLDWDSLPPDMPVEARLSRLVAWVLMAQAQGLSYGLRLPGQALSPDGGEAHLAACLAALALYGEKS